MGLQVQDLIQRYKSKELRIENMKQLIMDIEVLQYINTDKLLNMCRRKWMI